MADPVLPGTYRTLAILQSISEMSDDVFVNQWAFQDNLGPRDISAVAGDIATALDLFYGEISSFFTTSGLSSTIEYRTYDLALPAPRDPETLTSTLVLGTGLPLPCEVAVVMSFRGQLNVPTQRGRVFLGPFSQGAGTSSGARPGDLTVNNGLRTGIVDGATALLGATAIDWGIISQKNAQFVPVTQGWVDNAFDTQRSRGHAATERSTFGSA